MATLLAVVVGCLYAAGIYMMLRRSLFKLILGLVLLSHGANLVLLASGVSAWRGEPLTGTGDPAEAGDPLPMAFVLTAVVGSGHQAYLLVAGGFYHHWTGLQRKLDENEETRRRRQARQRLMLK